jgi:nucleoside-diphosphate-sugar epimerase
MTTKALVTGGNGYVGNALVRELVRLGVEVHALANRNSQRLEALLPAHRVYSVANDLDAVAALVAETRPDIIYHLAAVHVEPPTLAEMIAMIHCDIALGATLLHAACECNPHPAFVNIGSYWQFGDAANEHAPNTFYAAAKQSMHGILTYFRSVRGIRALTLVLYEVFGPNDPRPKLWNKLAKAERGSSFPVTEGRQQIEPVHVDDVVRAILLAGESLVRGDTLEPLYAVRSRERVTLRWLLQAVRERAGLDIQLDWGAVPYSANQVFSPWMGECLPGWQPSISPLEGIADLVKNGAAAARSASQAPEQSEKP